MGSSPDIPKLFRVYKRETAQFRFRDNVTLTEDMRGDLRLFGLFCRRYDLDPSAWIRARHEAIGWSRMIPIDRLATARFLGKYREFIGDLTARAESDEAMAESIVDDTAGAPLGGLRPHEEAFRAAMARVGAYDACLGSSGYMTGGYCPDSSWCGLCPVQQKCREVTRDRHVRSGRIRPRLSAGADTCVY